MGFAGCRVTVLLPDGVFVQADKIAMVPKIAVMAVISFMVFFMDFALEDNFTVPAPVL